MISEALAPSPAGQRTRAGSSVGVARLLEAASLEELAPHWLSLQVAQVGARGGGVFVEQAGALRALAVEGDRPRNALEPAVRAALETGRGSVLRSPGDAVALVAQPFALPAALGMRGAAVLAVDVTSPARLRAIVQELLWGAAWLSGQALRDALDAAADAGLRLEAAQALLAAVQSPREAKAGALAFATGLAHRLGADRVAVAVRRFTRTRIVAVSHSAEFGRQTHLNRLVAAAMDEALAQRASLTWPEPPDEANATRAQAALSRDRGGAAVLTVPFTVEGGLWRGAVTIERDGARPFEAEDVALVDAVAALAGPALWDKLEADRWLVVKAALSARRQAERLLGPGHLGRKLAAVCLVALTTLFATWTGTYRITADAVVEGAIERSLVAPFDGYLREALVRAGDVVAATQTVAMLDDRDLALERLRLMTARRQSELELGIAIGDRNRVDAEVATARIAQADAQIALVDEQIARARIVAPFDGIVVSGDQSRRVGAAIRQGDVLFEIAPAGDFRVALDVDDVLIASLERGQTGTLVLAAIPGLSVPIVVERVTPIAVSTEGRNRFRAEARIDGEIPSLRPGMRGIAKLDVDERLVVDIWTRPLRDWLRLQVWRWSG